MKGKSRKCSARKCASYEKLVLFCLIFGAEEVYTMTFHLSVQSVEAAGKFECLSVLDVFVYEHLKGHIKKPCHELSARKINCVQETTVLM